MAGCNARRGFCSSYPRNDRFCIRGIAQPGTWQVLRTMFALLQAAAYRGFCKACGSMVQTLRARQWGLHDLQSTTAYLPTVYVSVAHASRFR